MFSLEAYKALISSIVVAMDNISIEINSSSVRLGYSGRGMYGTECLGVVLDSYDMDNWKVEILEDITKKIKDGGNGDVVALYESFKKALRGPGRDSMGMSQIEYYQSINIPTEYREEISAIVESFVYND